MTVKILNCDVMDGLRQLEDESVHCVVTSPPYWGLRDYGVEGQIGLEATPDAFVARMVAVFREVRRVLRKDGTCWVNLGDGYATSGWAGWQGKNGQRADRRFTAPNLKPEASNAGLKPKDLIGGPWRVAFALQSDGWWLRSDIVWSKPNPMPESVTDRPTKAHEYVFLLTKAERYYYDAEAIKETAQYDGSRYGALPQMLPHNVAPKPMCVAQHKQAALGRNLATSSLGSNDDFVSRNKRSVWTIATTPFNGSALLADYVGADGRAYRRSEDCPVHGQSGRHQTLQTGGCDGQQDHQQSRTADSDGRPGEAHGAERGAIPSTTIDTNGSGSAPAHEPQSKPGRKRRGQSPKRLADALASADELQHRSGSTQECTTLSHDKTGSLPLSCSETAKPRSNGSHRTGRAPVTNLSCSASAQTDSRIVGTSETRAPSGSVERNPESNSALGGSGDHLSGQMESGSGRKFSSSKNNAKCTCLLVSTDHFATFPPELPEICIKAGCPVGGTVLDPFSGAGTTCLVADRLQRNAIGIELNPEYAAMAERRINADRGGLLDLMEAAE